MLGTSVVPVAQIIRGRKITQPGVERGAVFGQSAWPETVDQHARAVGSCRRVVDSLDQNAFWRGGHDLHRRSRWRREALLYHCTSARWFE
jgi:hypothetical protein